MKIKLAFWFQPKGLRIVPVPSAFTWQGPFSNSNANSLEQPGPPDRAGVIVTRADINDRRVDSQAPAAQ
jgi:hypothetical protein